ncbi:hypothetical protein ASPCAL09901 [Aspergillus calidoustus]|uniref:DUF7732 domain-containing protein n=1 Tax=Aspergillus calidoustus TaxID=454130 RepID=A0A0U5CBM7_ASPCI|nr:hypothetical protein ASPCAL09901 [Aspergillus calidoustus]
MKLAFATTITLLLSSTVTSLHIPTSDLSVPHGDIISPVEAPDLETRDLEKRRGGGGGGRGGGGSSGGGSGGRGGGSSSSSSSSSRPPSTRPNSNVGGSTPGGSGPRPAYGRGGAFYAGGATTPYRAGRPSPFGIAPFFLPVAALAFFPGLWLWGAHIYPYHHHYNYVNNTSNRNESLPVICLCEQYASCGCEDNNNSTYYESLFDGTQPKNTSIVKVTTVNGTQTIAINGTLPNGTTAVDPDSGAATLNLRQASGYWVMAAIAASAVYAL